jgi:hypothetical protein
MAYCRGELASEQARLIEAKYVMQENFTPDMLSPDYLDGGTLQGKG